MLSKLAIRRLTKLADFMDALPKEANKHFSMSVFFDHDGRHPIARPISALRQFDCGTIACAAGWACTIPAFKKDGLQMDSNGYVSFDGWLFEDAIDRFFDGEFFVKLFSAHLMRFIKTPKQWAKHCRKFLKANA